MADSSGAIESSLQEERVFPPPAEFARNAHIKTREEYDRLYRESIDQPEQFWGRMAEQLHWFKKWDRVLDWQSPNAKWFAGGKLNASYVCLDAQIEKGLGDKAAILWEGEPESGRPGSGGSVHRMSYRQLRDDVCRFANALKKLGVKKGDRVTIYMPMVPEAAIAMLACARLGAPHSVIFGGFSSQAIVDRVEDAKSNLIITADGGFRRGNVVPLKSNVDEALKKTDLVKKVVVLQRIGAAVDPHLPRAEVNWVEGRDVWWHEIVRDESTECPAEPMDAEDMLFVLYTSGSTGKPKGIIHTTGGYLLGSAQITTRASSSISSLEDVYWCSAAVGGITGHSYVVYGPLANGATTLMYEGSANYPDFGRFWSIIERHRVSVFYTAGRRRSRAFGMRASASFPDRPRSELVAAAGNRRRADQSRGVDVVSRCHRPRPLPDRRHLVADGDRGDHDHAAARRDADQTGYSDAAVLRRRCGHRRSDRQGIGAEPGRPAGDPQAVAVDAPRHFQRSAALQGQAILERRTWAPISPATAASAAIADGYFWIMGRLDDVINVAGHRLGTMEIESALVAHDAVAEAACVGMPHEMKGQGIAAFVTLANDFRPSEPLKKELIEWVGKQIGSIAKPDQIRFTEALPKTRSGKIMRRLLKELASSGEVKGDVTTLEDFSVIAKLKEQEEA